jgi:AraC family transcriptional regulator, positive regulator of tynA and feaB
MASIYATTDVHPRDGLAYWVEVVTRGFVRYAITTDSGPAFRASVHAGEIADLGIADYECDPHGVGRSTQDISRAESDDVFICLQVSGRSVHFQDDREAVIEGGSFFLLDPRKSFTGQFQKRGRIVSVRVPRQDLEARIGSAAPLAARALSSHGPVAGLAYGFLTMLPARMDALEGPAAARIAEQALDLLALAFSAESQALGLTLSSPRTVALTLLKAAIEARLHDQELKPAGAAAAAGISVRYANALLAQEDTCLERYIFARRLERCRRALADPAQANRMIGDIAFSWGFSDLSHFGRRFKAEYGCSPSTYRKRRAGAAIPHDDPCSEARLAHERV